MSSLPEGEQIFDIFFYYRDAILSINDIIALNLGKLYSFIAIGNSDDGIINANGMFRLDAITNIKAFSEYKTTKEIKIQYNGILYNFELPSQSFIENYKYYLIKSYELKSGTSITEEILELVNNDIAVLYKYFTPITKEEYDNLAKQN